MEIETKRRTRASLIGECNNTETKESNSLDGLKHLVVCLPLMKNTKLEDSLSKAEMVLDTENEVKCPGCSLHLGNKNKCAQHLLYECLLPKHQVDGEEFRSKLTKWLVAYFHVHFMINSTNNERKSIKQKKSNYEKRGKKSCFGIQLPVIPFDVQCPVCEKFFWPSEKCYKHLFEKCLYTENLKNAFCISVWFSRYLCSNSKSKLNLISNESQLRNLGDRMVCKYCRKEFVDRDNMMNHFRTSHRSGQDTGEPLCHLCNFKPGSKSLLFRHIMEKHVKCGCGERLKEFNKIKMHLALCPRRGSCLCPTCNEVEMGSLATEADFEEHVFSCRQPEPLTSCLNLYDLYTQCDICWQQILKCNIEIHIAQHIKLADCEKRKARNTFINIEDLKDVLSDEEIFKMKALFIQNKN